MVGESKILTVSYGTFSCTLEGFDDPFSTMRSIAEYFRDLAADDRYFGAEPPTPDAEMLQRIAEKEIQRKVDARVKDNNLVLTQMDDAEQDVAPLAPAAEAPAPVVAPETPVEPAPVADLGEIAATAYVAEYEDTEDFAGEDLPLAEEIGDVPAPDAGAAESVAEKLNRIRAVVNNTQADDADSDDTLEDEVEAQPVAVELEDMVAEDESSFEEDATEDDIAEAMAAFDAAYNAEADAVEADAVEADAVEDTVNLEDDAEQAVEDDAFVAELPAEDDLAEHADAEDFAESEEFDAVAELSDDGAGDAQDQADLATLDGVDVDEVDDVAAELSDHDEARSDDTIAAEQDVAEDEDDSAEVAADPVGRVIKLSTADAYEASEDDTFEDATEAEADSESWGGDWDSTEDTAEADEPADDVSETSSESPVEETAAEEVAAEADTPAEEPDEDDAFAAGIRAALEQASADADMSEDSFADDDIEDSAEENLDDALAAGADVARERLGDLAEATDDGSDVDRLLEKTNSQMEESEGSRRRSAIAHLKAAVAATKADRLLKRVSGGQKSETEEQTQYRDDLAQVVRPRRPEAATAENTEQKERPRPIAEGASPLMLVSELRVDEEDAQSGAAPISVRPRRVSHDDEAISDGEASSYEDGANFAEFADKMGAKELPDLLEAAAAYAAFVENQPHFSRPQLMKRVARHDASGEFSREAGLRSFGQLLRQGKIRKLKRGQFTVADTTRFNPEARIAGE